MMKLQLIKISVPGHSWDYDSQHQVTMSLLTNADVTWTVDLRCSLEAQPRIKTIQKPSSETAGTGFTGRAKPTNGKDTLIILDFS